MPSEKVMVNGGYPIHNFFDVLDKTNYYIHHEKDVDLIKKSYEFAKEKHDGQFRKSGEPYLQHLIEVAYILATLQASPITISAGFLHDVVEDSGVSIETIQELFGVDVASLVNALTKIQRLKLSKRPEEELVYEDQRKIFLGMAKDIRVIIIKLADRLHNMRTLMALSRDRQLILARETLNVFTPIAHRLGLNIIKVELEDLSLKYLEPEKYQQIFDALHSKEKNLAKSLDALKKRIAGILLQHQIPFEILSRVKSIYSIYLKIYEKGYSFEQIYDILALRILTETE
ncbi:MAG: HD domain-containing protein, partial [Erysipelotrichaceae bacterium]|nr:HD domain-containing protein [Erysipelotrichaceae bacterium]